MRVRMEYRVSMKRDKSKLIVALVCEGWSRLNRDIFFMIYKKKNKTQQKNKANKNSEGFHRKQEIKMKQHPKLHAKEANAAHRVRRERSATAHQLSEREGMGRGAVLGGYWPRTGCRARA